MFTGIVETTAKVISIDKSKDHLQLRVRADSITEDLKRGGSIAVDGVCLTATEFGEDWVDFDVIAETAERTTLSLLSIGDEVNIERSMKMGDEIGGHILSGHIWGTAQIVQIQETSYKLQLADSVCSDYVFAKGFVGINGASLTVGEVDKRCFWIHLIPETLKITNLDALKVGSQVNIELDSQTVAIVDTVERIMARRQASATS